MVRKIVQISTNHQSGSDEELSVFALCDDGTVWFTISGTGFGNRPANNPDEWRLVANVPQDLIDHVDSIWFSKKGY
tara:strand:+ start:1667 stop:1894 length:228 start_codon:yes stop_codon:yes gene_type:complete